MPENTRIRIGDKTTRDSDLDPNVFEYDPNTDEYEYSSEIIENLEKDCWSLVTKYADKLGIKLHNDNAYDIKCEASEDKSISAAISDLIIKILEGDYYNV